MTARQQLLMLSGGAASVHTTLQQAGPPFHLQTLSSYTTVRDILSA